MRWVTPIPYTEFSLCSFGKSAINEIGRAETDTSLALSRGGCGRRMNELQELEVFQSFFPSFLSHSIADARVKKPKVAELGLVLLGRAILSRCTGLRGPRLCTFAASFLNAGAT